MEAAQRPDFNKDLKFGLIPFNWPFLKSVSHQIKQIYGAAGAFRPYFYREKERILFHQKICFSLLLKLVLLKSQAHLSMNWWDNRSTKWTYVERLGARRARAAFAWIGKITPGHSHPRWHLPNDGWGSLSDNFSVQVSKQK